MGSSKSSSKRKIDSHTGLPQQEKNPQNLTLYLKELENEEQTKSKGNRGKETVKSRNKSNRNLKTNSKDPEH